MRTVLYCIALTVPGLAGAAWFMYAYPDWFYELGIVVGPFIAAAVATVVTGIVSIPFRLTWPLKLVSALGAAHAALVLTFWWSTEHQHEILALIRSRE